MSYIVPRDKPKQCNDCPFMYNDTLDCRLNKESYLYTLLDKQYTNCPLIEVPTPHGRLIDADFEEAHYTSMTVNPTPDVTDKDKRNSLIIIEALQMAKTIIEAEGRDS